MGTSSTSARLTRKTARTALRSRRPEFEILSAFPFDDYRIGALTIEHNGDEDQRARIRQLLESKGYRFVRQHVVEDWYTGQRTWRQKQPPGESASGSDP